MKKYSVTVMLDSNLLFAKNDVEVIAPAATALLEECSKYADVEICIPEVVYQELLFQKVVFATTLLADVRRNLTTLEKLTGTRQPTLLSQDELKEQIRSRLTQWCKENNIGVIATPIPEISWVTLIDAAIWHKPPFSPPSEKSEKGFKDALILETVFKKWAEHGKTAFAFVSGDELLREAAGEGQRADSGDFLVFDSLAAFVSHLKLSHEARSSAFVATLFKNAEIFFFALDSQECLAYTANVRGLIESRFADQLTTFPSWAFAKSQVDAAGRPLASLLSPKKPKLSPFGALWVPVSEEQVFCQPPLFERIEKDRYIWKSTIVFARVYQEGNESDYLVSEAVRIARFSVYWSCKVSDDAKLSDGTIDGIEAEGTRAETATFENLLRYNLPSKVDRMLQGMNERLGTDNPLSP